MNAALFYFVGNADYLDAHLSLGAALDETKWKFVCAVSHGQVKYTKRQRTNVETYLLWLSTKVGQRLTGPQSKNKQFAADYGIKIGKEASQGDRATLSALKKRMQEGKGLEAVIDKQAVDAYTQAGLIWKRGPFLT